jgi:hypothetical protein
LPIPLELKILKIFANSGKTCLLVKLSNASRKGHTHCAGLKNSTIWRISLFKIDVSTEKESQNAPSTATIFYTKRYIY